MKTIEMYMYVCEPLDHIESYPTVLRLIIDYEQLKQHKAFVLQIKLTKITCILNISIIPYLSFLGFF